MKKIALVTGVTGQDGAYLAEWLIKKDYSVIGLIARRATDNFWRLDQLNVKNEIEFVYGDLSDPLSLHRVLERYQPNEIYNLAAQSFVGESWAQPILTAQVNALGPVGLLEAMRVVCPAARYYQASTSEMFGKVAHTPQTEVTPFYPRSPYGVSKLYAHWMTINYRESYGLHANSGILFNHESPLRGEQFVTRKVTRAVANIKLGLQSKLLLGNLNAKRDWGHAKDYVRAMWLMLQQEEPGDYVIATGITHTIQYLCEYAFDYVGLNWRDYVEMSSDYVRPAEVDLLCGDASLAREKLGWYPEIKFEQLIEEMIEADMKDIKNTSDGAK